MLSVFDWAKPYPSLLGFSHCIVFICIIGCSEMPLSTKQVPNTCPFIISYHSTNLIRFAFAFKTMQLAEIASQPFLFCIWAMIAFLSE